MRPNHNDTKIFSQMKVTHKNWGEKELIKWNEQDL